MGKKLSSIGEQYTKIDARLGPQLKTVLGKFRKNRTEFSSVNLDQLVTDFIDNNFDAIIENEGMLSLITAYQQECKTKKYSSSKFKYYNKLKTDILGSISGIANKTAFKIALSHDRGKSLHYLTRTIQYTVGEGITVDAFLDIFKKGDLKKEDITSIRKPMLVQSFLTKLFEVKDGKLVHQDVLEKVAGQFGASTIPDLIGELEDKHGPFQVHYSKLKQSCKDKLEPVLDTLETLKIEVSSDNQGSNAKLEAEEVSSPRTITRVPSK